jgi:hypothetical protein
MIRTVFLAPASAMLVLGVLAAPAQADCRWTGWSWACGQPRQERHEQEWRERHEWRPPVRLHEYEHEREQHEHDYRR